MRTQAQALKEAIAKMAEAQELFREAARIGNGEYGQPLMVVQSRIEDLNETILAFVDFDELYLPELKKFVDSGCSAKEAISGVVDHFKVDKGIVEDVYYSNFSATE